MMPGFLGTSESFSKKIVPTNPIPKGTFQPPQAQPDNVRDFVRDFCLRMAVSRAQEGSPGENARGCMLPMGFPWMNWNKQTIKNMVHEVGNNGIHSGNLT